MLHLIRYVCTLFLWTAILLWVIAQFLDDIYIFPNQQLSNTHQILKTLFPVGNINNDNGNNYSITINNSIPNLDDSIAILVTACAQTKKRWDLLSAAIDSIEEYNTYPHTIRKIVMYDCNDYTGLNYVANKYSSLNWEFYNTSTPRIYKFPYGHKQYRIASSIIEGINLLNDSKIKMIFKTEDDWIFYRHNFIQTSLLIYKHNRYLNQNNLIHRHFKKISFIGLRAMQFHTPHMCNVHFCGGPTFDQKKKIYRTNVTNGNISYTFNKRGRSRNCYEHFSFQPSLIYKNLTKKYLLICLDKFLKGEGGARMERCVGCQYRLHGYMNVHVYDNGYYGHGGMIDNGYHIEKLEKYENASNISIITKSKEILDDGWILNMNNCTYTKV